MERFDGRAICQGLVYFVEPRDRGGIVRLVESFGAGTRHAVVERLRARRESACAALRNQRWISHAESDVHRRRRVELLIE